MKDRVQTSPPDIPKPAPHYSPLQQNYDRAVSPSEEEENSFLAEVGMSAPSIRSGNLPPTGLGILHGTSVKQSSTAFGDSDSVVSEDALASSRITVKGLTNLASYPNPVQKAAQNTLARARTANLPFQRSDTPLSVYGAPGLSKERVVSGGTGVIGTPQPLTAGPPGQRQFRPSTFEGAARALGRDQENPSPTLVPDAGEYQPDLAPSGPYPASLVEFFTSENIGTTKSTDGSTQSHKEIYHTDNVFGIQRAFGHTFPDEYIQSHMAVDPHLSPTSKKQAERRIPYDTEPAQGVAKYYPNGFAKDLGRKSRAMSEYDYGDYSSSQRTHGTASELPADMNRRFYAGTGALAKSLDQVVREHENCSLKNKIGVIGEGRDRFRTPHANRTGRDSQVLLPHLSVEQANNTHDSLHAEPLVSMAFATLLRHKEESETNKSSARGFSSGFTARDPSWVDDSSEGHKSFFDTSKAEQMKKKKAIKCSRVSRGY